MSESTLFKISFIVSILGLIGLIIFSNMNDVDLMNINMIDDNTLDAKISGEIVNIKSYEKATIFTIKQDSYMEIVVFENLSSSNISKGDNICVTGQSKKEDGKFKLYADTIELEK